MNTINPTPPTTCSGIEAIVCADVASRQALGINKYGTTVADNPLALRAWLVHQYEELLDAAVYCRRAIAEIDNPTRRAHDQSAYEIEDTMLRARAMLKDLSLLPDPCLARLIAPFAPMLNTTTSISDYGVSAIHAFWHAYCGR